MLAVVLPSAGDGLVGLAELLADPAFGVADRSFDSLANSDLGAPSDCLPSLSMGSYRSLLNSDSRTNSDL